MHARFSLANDASAPASAAQIAQALLTVWGCEDGAARTKAGKVVSEVARRIQVDPADRLVVGLRHDDNDILNITVGAYQPRGIRADREERSSTPIVLARGTGGPVQAAKPRRPARAKAPAHTAAPAPVRPLAPSGSDVTLADLAQRFEESPWFVRRRVAAGTLPPPDGEDAAGEPIWRAGTLGAWPDPAPADQQGADASNHSTNN